jgi:hypothetical protein
MLPLFDEKTLKARDCFNEFVYWNPLRMTKKYLSEQQRALSGFSDFMGEGMLMADIKPSMLEGFGASLLEKGYSPNTCSKMLRMIETVLSYAMDHFLLADWSSCEKPKAPESLSGAMDRQSFENFLSLEKIERRRRFWCFLLTTGLSPEAALALDWKNVRLDGEPNASLFSKKGKPLGEAILLPPAVKLMGEPKEEGPVFPADSSRALRKVFYRTAFQAKIKIPERSGMKAISLSVFSWLRDLKAPESELATQDKALRYLGGAAKALSSEGDEGEAARKLYPEGVLDLAAYLDLLSSGETGEREPDSPPKKPRPWLSRKPSKETQEIK